MMNAVCVTKHQHRPPGEATDFPPWKCLKAIWTWCGATHPGWQSGTKGSRGSSQAQPTHNLVSGSPEFTICPPPPPLV